jgi:hypothetical protein
MSDVVTATRQVIQDLLTPELRELRVRVEALEALMNERFRHTDEKIVSMEKHMDGRLDEIRALIVKQLEVAELRDRLARVEAQQLQAHQ